MHMDIYAHIHVGYCLQLFMNQLNSQFKSINLKFSASMYYHRISLAYTCHDAGFDTEFLQIVPFNFTYHIRFNFYLYINKIKILSHRKCYKRGHFGS